MNKQIASLSVDSPLREIFLEEVGGLIGRFERSLESLTGQPGDHRVVREIERIAMDIKGISSMVGLEDIATTMRATERSASLLIIAAGSADNDFLQNLYSARNELQSVVALLSGHQDSTAAGQIEEEDPPVVQEEFSAQDTSPSETDDLKPVTEMDRYDSPLETFAVSVEKADTASHSLAEAPNQEPTDQPIGSESLTDTSSVEDSQQIESASTSGRSAAIDNDADKLHQRVSRSAETDERSVDTAPNKLDGSNFQNNLIETFTVSVEEGDMTSHSLEEAPNRESINQPITTEILIETPSVRDTQQSESAFAPRQSAVVDNDANKLDQQVDRSDATDERTS